MNDPNYAELRGDARIDWMYPSIYPQHATRSRLKINILHTRASGTLIIEFDGGRDGFIISMDRTNLDGEVLKEHEEVAFVPAWNEEEENQP